MLVVRLAGDHLYGEITLNLAVAGDVFDGVLLCSPFPHEMSWMISGTLLRQFLRGFLSILPTPACFSGLQLNMCKVQLFKASSAL